jgi:methanogenic corrinoid protein MtbC1
MDDARECFRREVDTVATLWLCDGLPSRQALMAAADQLTQLRNQLEVESLWHRAPLMLTATLDDGLGQGLSVIEAFAAAIGMDVIPLGLMQPPDAVIDACQRHLPHFLGMTVLQFDTEDALCKISRALPEGIRIVAGGPVFTADPGFADRTGTDYAARNAADFLRFMLASEQDPPIPIRHL